MNFLENFDLKEALRQKNVRVYIVAVSALVVGYAGYLAYSWRNNTRQQLAQRSFSEAVDTYKNVMFEGMDQPGQDSRAKWDEVELAFNIGYEQNKKSTFAPFFLAYESDAQLRMGKFDEAYKRLTEALEAFPRNSQYYYLYKTKHVLMQLDKFDEKNGLSELISLSNDKNNIFKDMASFYLGEYYFANNDLANAKLNYQNALAFNPESSWGVLSKAKLEKFK